MSSATNASRANRATTALADLLTSSLGITFYSQWAGPETGLKDILAAGDSAGCVTCGGASQTILDGVEEYEEPADGASGVLQKYGTETLVMQVDVFCPSIDDRWVVLGKLEELFDTGPDSEDGVVFLTLADGGAARYVRTGSRITDSAESAGGREWRATLTLEAEVDIVSVETAPLLADLVVRLRFEDETEPPPPPNTLGKTIGDHEFQP